MLRDYKWANTAARVYVHLLWQEAVERYPKVFQYVQMKQLPTSINVSLIEEKNGGGFVAARLTARPLCVHQAMEAAMLAMEGNNEEIRRYIEQFLPARLDAPE